MKLLILSDLGNKPTRAGLLTNNSRPAAVYHIADIARKHDVDAEVIDYWRSWDYDLLVESILTWFGSEKDCWISLSGSIDGSSTDAFKALVTHLKQEVDLRVMLGGYRITVGESDWVDIAFIGRSVNIFEKWLQGEDISEYLHNAEPPTYKNKDRIIREDPVVIIPRDEDFWQKEENMTIELSLGCKFNCSFCGYDYRNNKNPVFAKKQRIKDSLETAYYKFGIKEVILADDTINEIDTKIELLAEVVDELDFEPNFMAFARLDVLGAQRHQLEILKRARINSMFFGIESLNPNVTKVIRKGGRPEKNFDTLQWIKEEYPEAFTYGNFINGLTGDNEESIRYFTRAIIDQQLLTSAGSNNLRLYSSLDNKEIMSDMDLYPEKFGYEIIGTDREWPELGYSSQHWKNDWTDSYEMTDLNYWVDKSFSEGLVSKFTGHEMASLRATLPDQPWGNYNNTFHLHNRGAKRAIKRYITAKSNFLKGIA